MQIARRYCNVKSANCFTAIKHSIEEGDVGGWEWGGGGAKEFVIVFLYSPSQNTQTQHPVAKLSDIKLIY